MVVTTRSEEHQDMMVNTRSQEHQEMMVTTRSEEQQRVSFAGETCEYQPIYYDLRLCNIITEQKSRLVKQKILAITSALMG